jgi:hypothetical protein
MGLTAHVDDGSIPWDITFTLGVDARPDQPERIGFSRIEIIQRPLGPPIVPSMIQGVGIGALLDQAMKMGAYRVYMEPIEDDQAIDVKPPAPSRRKGVAAVREMKEAVARDRRDEAIRLYHREKALGTVNPLGAVADEMGVSRSTVGNYIKAAKVESIRAEKSARKPAAS